MTEKQIENKLKAIVEKDLKGLCLKLFSPWFTGLPDRLCLLPSGVIAFAELKTKKGRTSPRQKIVHRQLATLGFAVYIIYDKNTLNEFKTKYTA